MSFDVSASTNISLQSSINDFFQVSTTACTATCSNEMSNININIFDSTTGDINVHQNCTAEASCIMTNNLSAIATTQLDTTQRADTKNVPHSYLSWPGYSVSVSTNITEQSLRNTISQVISSSCEANASQLTENVTINITKSTVGNINLDQEGQASAACQMTNTASIVTSSSASASQTATASNGRTVTTIAILFIAVLGAILILYTYFRDKSKVESEKVKSQERISEQSYELEKLRLSPKPANA